MKSTVFFSNPKLIYLCVFNIKRHVDSHPTRNNVGEKKSMLKKIKNFILPPRAFIYSRVFCAVLNRILIKDHIMRLTIQNLGKTISFSSFMAPSYLPLGLPLSRVDSAVSKRVVEFIVCKEKQTPL